MTKEIFLKLLSEHHKLDKYVNDLQSFLRCDIFEALPFETAWTWFDDLMSTSFNSEGLDYINAYLYDNLDKCELILLDEDGEPLIAAYSDEDLWNLLMHFNCLL